jgi:hypothetical protein
MLTQAQLVQLRALARRAVKLTGHVSAVAETLGLDVVAQAFKAFTFAFLLLVALLTVALRQAVRLTAVTFRFVRAVVARLVLGGMGVVLLAAALTASDYESLRGNTPKYIHSWRV